MLNTLEHSLLYTASFDSRTKLMGYLMFTARKGKFFTLRLPLTLNMVKWFVCLELLL